MGTSRACPGWYYKHFVCKPFPLSWGSLCWSSAASTYNRGSSSLLKPHKMDACYTLTICNCFNQRNTHDCFVLWQLTACLLRPLQIFWISNERRLHSKAHRELCIDLLIFNAIDTELNLVAHSCLKLAARNSFEFCIAGTCSSKCCQYRKQCPVAARGGGWSAR